MAAFSHHHHHPFLLDTVFLPNTPIKIPGFSEEPHSPASYFPQFDYPDESLGFSTPESSSLENGSKKVAFSSNEASVTNKHSTDSSSVVDYKPESGEQVTQKVAFPDRKRKSKDRSSRSSSQSKSARGGEKKQKNVRKEEEEKKVQKKDPEEAPTGYIHVRARRGQATDRHSLAERVRREKISERMKQLQALVPGCDKVTGKALMLDEIINYVQSLQHQVEFLSLKLSSMNPMRYDFGMDLDAFMATPEGLNGMISPILPNVQKCGPEQTSAFCDAPTTFTSTPNSYPLLDTSSLQFHQLLPQDNGPLLWDVDQERHKLINHSAFANNLCSFH